MVKDKDIDLAATIEAAYVDMGTPVEVARALIDGSFALHYQLEEDRAKLLTNLDRDTIILVVQLEVIHLQHALHHIMEHVAPVGTVQ